MNRNVFVKSCLLGVISLTSLIILSDSFARTGNEIIATAQTYLNLNWTCNPWNARPANNDGNPDTNSYDYPFWPADEPYKEKGSDEIKISTGSYTGEAYAYGLIDTPSEFQAKLLNPNIQAGSRNIVDSSKYAGIDCSGFVGRCAGINFEKVNCYHLMEPNLTDSIDWNEVVKGDILINPSHVALVTSRTGDTVNVIESAVHYGSIYSLKGMRVMSNTYSRKNGVFYRDNHPGTPSEYKPYRFTPPILKKITIKLDESGEVLYQAKWTESTTTRTLDETPDDQIIPAKAGDIVRFELEFSKAMDNTFGITATFGPTSPYNQHTIPPLDNGRGGWDSQINYGNVTFRYKKWIGRFEVPSDPSYDGLHHISIKAKSVTDCELDSDQKTIAKRTAAGGWSEYSPGNDTLHRFQIFTSEIYTMDFEDGTDGAVIRSRIPGLTFTTTQGYDWIYGDKRTGDYNIPPYGEGAYHCNGNFFAWLGPNQGEGRIDFTGATTTRVSFGYSSAEATYLEAYDSNGILIDSDSGPENLYTGRLDRVSVSGASISYVLVHDAGNFWLVDDLIVEDLLRETIAQYLPQGFERALEILDVIDIGSPRQIQFVNNVLQILKIILNWTGSEMKLELYKPDGTLYGQWQSSTPPIIVDIPPAEAEVGEWEFIVTAMDIPFADYPFAVVVGTRSAVVTYSTSLNSGWNLISIPVEVSDPDRDAILAPIAEAYDSAWTYDAETQEWRRYIRSGPTFLNNLDTVQAGHGYWLFMNAPAALTIAGTTPSPVIQLFKGWNLAGYNYDQELSVTDAISCIGGKYSSVWTYNENGQWLRYIPSGPGFLNNLNVMGPGRGYWIDAIVDCVWDISASGPSPAPPIAGEPQSHKMFSAEKPGIPYTIWGNVEADGVKMTKERGCIVLLKVDNKIHSRYRLGTVGQYDDYYVLDVPAATNSSTQIDLYVQIDDTAMKAAPVPLGRQGQIIRIDLSMQISPEVSVLHQNYPNPSNPDTWIPYQLKEDADVVIKIYTVTGQLVRTLNLGHKPAGFYTDKERTAYWDGKNEASEHVASGVYFYQIQAGRFSTMKKLVVLR